MKYEEAQAKHQAEHIHIHVYVPSNPEEGVAHSPHNDAHSVPEFEASGGHGKDGR
jgi:hypothetical protein